MSIIQNIIMGLLIVIMVTGIVILQKNRHPKTKDMLNPVEDGFIDISLNIIEKSKENNADVFTAKGFYKSKEVGLKFIINSHIPKGIAPTGELLNQGFVNDAVQIISIGKESDEFIKALSELYKFPTDKPFSKQIKVPAIFSLNQADADFDKPNYYNFKMFFDFEGGEAELYLNINTANQIIELNEKDPEYRQALIEVFTKS